MSNNKVANINVKIKNFFFRYIEFLKPFHKLNNQQQQILALLLYNHYMLKQEITNNKILWKQVFDYDTKIIIAEDLNIKMGAIENILSQLRKKNVIREGEISPVYIPELQKNAKMFSITFNFKIDHGQTT
jgi:DNA-binding MarR family transcriptional regulator